MQKIRSNETLLNAALSDHSEDIKAKGESKTRLKEEIKVLSSEVKELTKEHDKIKTKCDRIRNKIEEITNTSSNEEMIMNMRRRVEDLKKEIKEKDLRIGVLSSVILNRQKQERRDFLDQKNFGGEEIEIFQVDDNQMEELM